MNHQKQYDAAFLGMINFDISVKGFSRDMACRKQSYVPPIVLGAGGDAQNCAISFARLGGRTAVCGRIGQDTQGDVLTRTMADAGVDTRWLIRSPEGTGTVVNLIQDCEASHVAHLGGNGTLSDGDISDELLRATRAVCLNSLFGCGKLTHDVMQRARAWGAVTAADTNTVPEGVNLEQITPMLAQLDYFLPSWSEARALTGENDPARAARKFLDAGATYVVIKLGGWGCYYAGQGQAAHVPGFPIDPVDFTGCGDNFTAAFLMSRLKGYDMLLATKLANAAGALTACHLGASGAVQSFEQLIDFCSLHKTNIQEGAL